jgi:hypothetical protein
MFDAPVIRSTAAVGVLALGLVLSCNAPRTAVTHVWQAPMPRAIKSVVVFAGVPDEAGRRTLEDRFATELARHDVKALRAYDALPGAADDAQVRARAKQLGVEGVLVVKPKARTDKTSYVPNRGGAWSTYQGPTWEDPRYLAADATVTFETSLWDAHASEELLWSVTTRTTKPEQGGGEASLVKTIVAELEGAQRIPSGR